MPESKTTRSLTGEETRMMDEALMKATEHQYDIDPQPMTEAPTKETDYRFLRTFIASTGPYNDKMEKAPDALTRIAEGFYDD
jgi:hypothetical protein